MTVSLPSYRWKHCGLEKWNNLFRAIIFKPRTSHSESSVLASIPVHILSCQLSYKGLGQRWPCWSKFHLHNTECWALLLTMLAKLIVMISSWISVFTFSCAAVKSLFHTQMRWVSPFQQPWASESSPSLACFAGAAPFSVSLAAVHSSEPESCLYWMVSV